MPIIFQVEQLLAGQEDSQGNVNYEEFVTMLLLKKPGSHLNRNESTTNKRGNEGDSGPAFLS